MAMNWIAGYFPPVETDYYLPEERPEKTMIDFPLDYPRTEITKDQMPHNFEDYLKLHMALGHTEFNLKARNDESGRPSFYIHTKFLDSLSYDFQVHGNALAKAWNPPEYARIGNLTETYDLMRRLAQTKEHDKDVVADAFAASRNDGVEPPAPNLLWASLHWGDPVSKRTEFSGNSYRRQPLKQTAPNRISAVFKPFDLPVYVSTWCVFDKEEGGNIVFQMPLAGGPKYFEPGQEISVHMAFPL